MKHTEPTVAAKQPRSRRKLAKLLLLATAGVLLIYGAVQIWLHYSATHKSPAAISSQTLTNSTDNPEETQPDCDNYRVASDQPRKIDLPTIKSNGCIIQVGVDQKSAIAAPNNIHLAGWFTSSQMPGAAGLSIIDGHVNGKYNPGIFKNLGKLKPKDQFSIEFGNGSKKMFEVVSINTYSIDETTKKMYEKAGDIENQLNLITCGGQFNKESQQYDKRVLVTSKLL